MYLHSGNKDIFVCALAAAKNEGLYVVFYLFIYLFKFIHSFIHAGVALFTKCSLVIKETLLCNGCKLSN